MRDDLTYIHNPAEKERMAVLAQFDEHMERLFRQYPQLKTNYEQAALLRKQIISASLAKLRGNALDEKITELENSLHLLLEQRLALLVKYKIDPSSLSPQWKCPRCQDMGMILEGDRYIRCSCRDARRLQLFRERAELPVRIASASFAASDFSLYQPELRSQAKKIYAYVRKFCDIIKVDPQGKGLYIFGPTGSGKSYLLGSIANYLLEHMSVRYLVYADFLDQLRASFEPRSSYSEQQLMDEVKGVDLLLLDDLGVEKPSEFSLKYLAQIIDYRYRNLKPLVVTSNYTLAELLQRSQQDFYTERIVWRLKEMCANILELKGNLRDIL